MGTMLMVSLPLEQKMFIQMVWGYLQITTKNMLIMDRLRFHQI
jgi:hypothetical protein